MEYSHASFTQRMITIYYSLFGRETTVNEGVEKGY